MYNNAVDLKRTLAVAISGECFIKHIFFYLSSFAAFYWNITISLLIFFALAVIAVSIPRKWLLPISMFGAVLYFITL